MAENRRRRTTRPAVSRLEHDPPGQSPNPLNELILDEEQLEIWTCIERLDERSRTAIKLKFWEDLTIAEIAESMDLQEGNVKVILHRAKDDLGQMLARTDEDFERRHTQAKKARGR